MIRTLSVTHRLQLSHRILSCSFVNRWSSVRYFATDLNEILIVTNSCLKRIRHLQDKSQKPDLYLRLAVEGGGCSGFQYTFKTDDASLSPDDKVFGKDDAKVVVDSASFDLVKGSTVDYVQEMIRSSFAVVNNPQSESACGCGSSFAVKNFSANPAKD
eukprot:gene2186-2387_t